MTIHSMEWQQFKKVMFIDRNFLNLQKELKEVAGEYCTDKDVELLILTKVFICCK